MPMDANRVLALAQGENSERNWQLVAMLTREEYESILEIARQYDTTPPRILRELIGEFLAAIQGLGR